MGRDAGEEFHAAGRLAALSDVAAPLGPTKWRGFVADPITIANLPLRMPLQPEIYRVAKPLFVPPHWAVLTEDSRLVIDGATVNPMEMMDLWNDSTSYTEKHYKLQGQYVFFEQEIFFLGGDSGNNYYHWLIDFIPKLLIYCHSEHFVKDRPVAIKLNIPEFARQLLRLAPVDQVPALLFPDNVSAGFSSALLVSNTSLLSYVHPFTLLVLRDAYGRLFRPHPRVRLLVSRASAARRKLLNEDAILARLAPFGFIRVAPETMTVQEQIALFSAAEVVVAPHGAALANLAWMPGGGGLVVELFPDGPQPGMYKSIVTSLANRYECLAAPAADTRQPGNVLADFTIDPERVVAALESAGITAAT